MTLLSKARSGPEADSEKIVDETERKQRFTVEDVSRVKFPSKYRRDALCVDVVHPTTPGKTFRLINVHLDSLQDALGYRALQIEILADILREPGCSGGVIAGDFNAISPEDDEIVDENSITDAWLELYGTSNPRGATWGVDPEVRGEFEPGRLDKVTTVNLKVSGMGVIRPGVIEMSKPGKKSREIPWSDHCGLRSVLIV